MTRNATRVRPAIPIELNTLGGLVVDAAFRVHTELGPGMLESTYEICLVHELSAHHIKTERQVSMPVSYRGVKLDAGYRLDLWVERKIVVEVKSVDKFLPVHEAQLLTYLRLSGSRLGYLINFNSPGLKVGIKRMAL